MVRGLHRGLRRSHPGPSDRRCLVHEHVVDASRRSASREGLPFTHSRVSAGVEQALPDPSARRAVGPLVKIHPQDQRALDPTEVIREFPSMAFALPRSQAEVRGDDGEPNPLGSQVSSDEAPAKGSSLPGQVVDVHARKAPGRTEEHGVADAGKESMARYRFHAQ